MNYISGKLFRFFKEYLYSLLLLFAMEMILGLNFRELEGLEVLWEVHLLAVRVAHAKALWSDRALCL